MTSAPVKSGLLADHIQPAFSDTDHHRVVSPYMEYQTREYITTPAENAAAMRSSLLSAMKSSLPGVPSKPTTHTTNPTICEVLVTPADGVPPAGNHTSTRPVQVASDQSAGSSPASSAATSPSARVSPRTPSDFWDEFSDDEESSSEEAAALHEGTLELHGGFIAGWKAYHCEIVSDSFCVFKPPSAGGGAIEVPLASAEFSVTRKNSRQFCFQLNSPCLKQGMLISAPDEPNLAIWLMKLHQAKQAAVNTEIDAMREQLQQQVEAQPACQQQQQQQKPQQHQTQGTRDDIIPRGSPLARVKNEELIFTKGSKQSRLCLNDFKLISVLGKGSYGKVLKVQKKFGSGQIYAMKVMKKTHIIQKDMVVKTKAERALLQKLNHPFIVKMHYAFQSPKKLYLIMDLLSGGDLFFHIRKERRLKTDTVRLYTAQILLALEKIHRLDVVYRDLKPENVVLDQGGNCCLTDFGMAKMDLHKNDQSGKTYSFCGTPDYAAPEIITGKGHTTAVDWWALGCLVYEMLVGHPPFYAENPQAMFQTILSREPRYPSSWIPSVKDFVMQLLHKDPEQRLTDPTQMKKHRFFAQLDWQQVYNKDITPEFVPDCGIDEDRYVDDIFRNDIPMLTPETPFDLSGADSPSNPFRGFSYAASVQSMQSPPIQSPTKICA